MKTHDRAPVCATPEAVWPYVADPGLIPLWNPKLVAIDHRGGGLVAAGDQFTATYQLSGRETKSEVRVLSADAPYAVDYEHRIDGPNGTISVVESYRIEPKGDAAWVRQTVDLGQALPWWIKPLFWFIDRFGKPVGRSTMQELAHVVETDQAASRRLPSTDESP